MSIILGNNLKIMDNINNVDLVYMDPPYYTQRKFNDFNDKWDNIDSYIDWLVIRLNKVYKTLKSTGSLYLQCDNNASHYIKIELDKIFGYDNFHNEIIWKRCSSHNLSKGFDNITDSIFYYTKSDNYILNTQYSLDKNIDKFNMYEEKTNRYFTTYPLEKTTNINDNKERIFYDHKGNHIKIKAILGWIWTQKTINDRWAKNNHIFHFTKNGKVRYKLYSDEFKGNKCTNLWYDIPFIASTSKEYLNYSTQKPELLLDRIIRTSSNPNNIVLDPFCGSGTTLKVAQNLNRQYIGIDNNERAIDICKKRLKSFNDW